MTDGSLFEVYYCNPSIEQVLKWNVLVWSQKHLEDGLLHAKEMLYPDFLIGGKRGAAIKHTGGKTWK